MPNELKASRTAVQVCQGRAAADGRIAIGRFADPTAMHLLRADERAAVQWVREGVAPRGWRERVDYETVRVLAELMVPRTVAIDDAVRAHPTAQVVILGAGLDGRTWRMPELADATVFEVDQPASQSDKRDRAAGLPGKAPAFVPVDFGRDQVGEALAAAGHRADRPTTWVWEGVVPYLTEAQVAATVTAVSACSPPGSRIIVNFQVPATFATVGRVVSRMLTASTGRSSVWADEPWRSAWTSAEMADLLGRHGYTVAEDRDMAEMASVLGTPIEHPKSLGNSRVMVADRT